MKTLEQGGHVGLSGEGRSSLQGILDAIFDRLGDLMDKAST